MAGNPVPRIAEVRGGMLNSIGLQNRGVDYFLREKVPLFRDLGTRVIVNVAGRDEAEYTDVVRRLDGIDGIDAFEINISCPNVKKGGMLFGSDPESAFRVMSSIRKTTELPVIAKLTPNVTDPGIIAKTVEEAGSDGISLINTIRGMSIDLRTLKPVLASGIGGFSGPAIKPAALANLWIVLKATALPVIGMGGIMNGQDALEFIAAGAVAVQLGTVFFVNPRAPEVILEEMTEYLRTHGYSSLKSLIGVVNDSLGQQDGS
jgi:dihydroorotate dehydrogenase (NAD+) catalytic subunit